MALTEKHLSSVNIQVDSNGPPSINDHIMLLMQYVCIFICCSTCDRPMSYLYWLLVYYICIVDTCHWQILFYWLLVSIFNKCKFLASRNHLVQRYHEVMIVLALHIYIYINSPSTSYQFIRKRLNLYLRRKHICVIHKLIPLILMFYFSVLYFKLQMSCIAYVANQLLKHIDILYKMRYILKRNDESSIFNIWVF